LALDPGSAEAQGLLAEVGISYFASAGETVTVLAAIVLLCGIGLALFGIVALGEWAIRGGMVARCRSEASYD
jgi:hypothetical protein